MLHKGELQGYGSQRLTNTPITSSEEACEKIEWYKQRWNVEIFHKILKSGCLVESAQLRSREKLIKYITINSIVAWTRLMAMVEDYEDLKEGSQIRIFRNYLIIWWAH